MERRLLLATLTSVLVVTLYMLLTGQCSPPKPKPAPPAPLDAPAAGAQPGAPAAPGQPAPAPAPAPGAPEPVEPADEGPQTQAPAVTATLENEELEVGLTSHGGNVAYVLVKGAHDPGRTEPFVLVAPSDPELSLGALDDAQVEPGEAPGSAERREARAGPLRRLNWTRDEAAEAKTPESDVVYTFTTADGRVFTKHWRLTPGAGRFDLHLRLSVRGGAGAVAVPVKLLTTGGMLAEEPSGMAAGPAMDAVYRLASQSDVLMGHPFGFAPVDVKPGGLEGQQLALLGARSTYFLVGAYAPPGSPALPTARIWATGEDGARREAAATRLKDWFRARFARVAEAGKDEGLRQRLLQGTNNAIHAWVRLDLSAAPEAAPVDLALYAGPVARATLRQDAYAPLASVITYPGGPDWLANVLLWIYDRWLQLLGSVGLAVILMTITVRGALMPLSIKNQLGMRRYGRKVQRLKPKVEQLKTRFANNPQKLREETMLLYKEHGVGFPAGCLMMLLQIPIFFALFASLRMEYSLRGQPFLWIPELSGPDRLVDLPVGFPVISSINLLPLLMVVLSVFQMRMMPKAIDPQQEQQMRMMKWMPVLFAVILYSYTAALSLYMVVSSVLALIESKIVKAKDAHDVAAA